MNGWYVLGLFAASFGILSRSTESVNFDDAKTGIAPPNWSVASSHRGAPMRWLVHPDATAPSHPNVLAQLANDRNPWRYAMALYDKGYCRDGDLSAEMKIISSTKDETGGLVWRYQDPQNFYLLHVSANEDTIAVLRVQDGKTTPVARLGPGLKAFKVSHRIEPLEWNVLKVSFKDNHITVYFDHRKVMDAEDTGIQKPGKTGLWTKGETIAYFDNFRIDKRKD